jgi:DHA1 family tetracycline resistance protein-like MFS transporter
VLGGFLAEFGTRAPFWAAAALAAGNAALGALVLSESVTERTRRALSWLRANPFGAFRSIGALPGLTPLMWVYFFYAVANVVYPATWAYLTTERFGWDTRMIGISLGVYGLSFALVQAFLVGPAVRLMGEWRTVVVGLVLEMLTLVFVGVNTVGLLALACIPIAALGTVGAPALQGLMSRAVANDAQGELQGVLTSINAVAMISAPIAMTQVFAYFSRPDAPAYLPGAPYLLAAGLVAAAIAVFVSRSSRAVGAD